MSMDHLDRVVEEAVIQRTHAAIVESLANDGENLIASVVKLALEAKVKDGYRDVPFIQKVARDQIQEVAQEAIKDWAQGTHEKIRDEIQRQLSSPATQKRIASALIEQMVKAADGAARWNFALEIHEKKDD